MPELSAGLLLYRHRSLEMLLVHPGGPYWAKKDVGSWTIPKGRYEPGEDPLAAALREFEEETGCKPPPRAFKLGEFHQPRGKIISAWAAEGDFDLASFRSNTFEMEWPPRSKRKVLFPEIDRAAWLAPEAALVKIIKGQMPIIAALLKHLG